MHGMLPQRLIEDMKNELHIRNITGSRMAYYRASGFEAEKKAFTDFRII
jgi:hypothetical protein